MAISEKLIVIQDVTIVEKNLVGYSKMEISYIL